MPSERSQTVRKRRAPYIDLIPLMDTIFLLLFFFLCAAIIQSSSTIADLSGSGEKPEKYQTITITKDSISGLENIEPLPVLIKADMDVDFGRINGVLRVLQERGVLRVNFAL